MKLKGYFHRAKTESYKKNGCNIDVGAVITRGGKVISVGRNAAKTHPLIGTYNIHAEASAIFHTKDKSKLNGSTIWVYRETADGIPAMAKPCDDCMKWIIESGIRTIYYSVSYKPFYRKVKV